MSCHQMIRCHHLSQHIIWGRYLKFSSIFYEAVITVLLNQGGIPLIQAEKAESLLTDVNCKVEGFIRLDFITLCTLFKLLISLHVK